METLDFQSTKKAIYLCTISKFVWKIWCLFACLSPLPREKHWNNLWDSTVKFKPNNFVLTVKNNIENSDIPTTMTNASESRGKHHQYFQILPMWCCKSQLYDKQFYIFTYRTTLESLETGEYCWTLKYACHCSFSFDLIEKKKMISSRNLKKCFWKLFSPWC